jgi:hypothetical protein
MLHQVAHHFALMALPNSPRIDSHRYSEVRHSEGWVPHHEDQLCLQDQSFWKLQWDQPSTLNKWSAFNSCDIRWNSQMFQALTILKRSHSNLRDCGWNLDMCRRDALFEHAIFNNLQRDLSPVHRRNTRAPILQSVDGIGMLANDLQLENDSGPIE